MASGKRPQSPHSSDEQPQGEPAALSNDSVAPDTGQSDQALRRSSEPLSSAPAARESPSAAATGADSSASVMQEARPRSLFPALLAASSLGAAAALLAAAVLWFGGVLPTREDNVSPVAARVAALELQARDLSGQASGANENRTTVEALGTRLARL